MSWCPYCDANLDSVISGEHANSEEEWEFEMNCPQCKKKLGVEVSIAEYEYEPFQLDDEKVVTEKDAQK